MELSSVFRAMTYKGCGITVHWRPERLTEAEIALLYGKEPNVVDTVSHLCYCCSHLSVNLLPSSVLQLVLYLRLILSWLTVKICPYSISYRVVWASEQSSCSEPQPVPFLAWFLTIQWMHVVFSVGYWKTWTGPFYTKLFSQAASMQENSNRWGLAPSRKQILKFQYGLPVFLQCPQSTPGVIFTLAFNRTY